MSRLKASNNFQTTLSGFLDGSSTSFGIVSAVGIPATPFRITIGGTEIVEVATVNGNTCSNVLRGQEGTTATAHNAGTKVECLVTAGMYNELLGPGEGSIKNNYSATGNPTVDDDSGDGYSVGSTWINVTSDIAYVCLDETAGAAKWEKISGLAAHLAETVSYVKLESVNLETAGASITVALLAGRIPKSISLLALIDGTVPTSQGVWSPNNQYCFAWRVNRFEYSGKLGMLWTAEGNVGNFIVSSVASGSCTLSYTKTGTPTGTAQLILQVLYHD